MSKSKYYKLPAAILPLGLSARACIVYAILADRMELSRTNKKFQDKDGSYIIFRVHDLCAATGAGERTIKYALAELEDYGIIKRKKQGRNLPQKIYVTEVQNTALPEVQNTAPPEVQNTAPPEVQNTAPLINNTEINTDISSSVNERGLKKLITLIDETAASIRIQLTDDQIFRIMKKARKQGDKIGNLQAWLKTVIRNVAALPAGEEDKYEATYDIEEYESRSVIDDPDW